MSSGSPLVDLCTPMQKNLDVEQVLRKKIRQGISEILERLEDVVRPYPCHSTFVASTKIGLILSYSGVPYLGKQNKKLVSCHLGSF